MKKSNMSLVLLTLLEKPPIHQHRQIMGFKEHTNIVKSQVHQAPKCKAQNVLSSLPSSLIQQVDFYCKPEKIDNSNMVNNNTSVPSYQHVKYNLSSLEDSTVEAGDMANWIA